MTKKVKKVGARTKNVVEMVPKLELDSRIALYNRFFKGQALYGLTLRLNIEFMNYTVPVEAVIYAVDKEAIRE